MSTIAPVRPTRPASPPADLDQQFEAIARDFTVVDLTPQMPRKNRITVLLDLPHLKQYGRDTTVELVYGCTFAVSVGELVSCPPMPGKNSRTTGIVVALDGGQYRGPVKHVRKIKTPPTPESETSRS